MKGPHGHPGQRAIVEGHVKEAAATVKAAKAQAAADSSVGSAGSLTKLIDQESRRAGIDPRIMEGIRAGESGHKSIRQKRRFFGILMGAVPAQSPTRFRN